MKHLESFRSRTVLVLPLAESKGWRLKRYAILAKDRAMDPVVAKSATIAMLDLLPAAGDLCNESGNHGVGFQIIHFAEQVAAVSSHYYWQWASVLAGLPQMRSDWDTPARFGPGRPEVIGCVWEMQIVTFETNLWTRTMLTDSPETDVRLETYLSAHYEADVG